MNTQNNAQRVNTLADVLKAFRRERPSKRRTVSRGRSPSLFGNAKVKGRITARLRDKATGEILEEREEENTLSTFFFYYLLYWNTNCSTMEISIQNNPNEYNALENGRPSSIVGTFSQAAASSFSWGTMTRTYSTTFDAPTQNRIIRWIGFNQGTYTTGNLKVARYVMTGKTLSVPITQTTTQTLEIVYRLTFVRA